VVEILTGTENFDNVILIVEEYMLKC